MFRVYGFYGLEIHVGIMVSTLNDHSFSFKGRAPIKSKRETLNLSP